MRQIVLDTETTGLDPKSGHRIIEIGCVELVNRKMTGNNYHQYINPNREIDAEAVAVHGITNEFLADKPQFAQIAETFFNYISGAELIIHNAAFDVGFINHEFKLLAQAAVYGAVADHCRVTDTLILARSKHRGQKNSLDALCRRYEIDNSHRSLHGALLDAEILAEVYLAMTGGQISLSLEGDGDSFTEGNSTGQNSRIERISSERPPLKVIPADAEELVAHTKLLTVIQKRSGMPITWE